MDDKKDIAKTDAIEPVDVEDVASIVPPTRPIPTRAWGPTGLSGPMRFSSSTGLQGHTSMFENPFARSNLDGQESIRTADPVEEDLEWTPPGMNIK